MANASLSSLEASCRTACVRQEGAQAETNIRKVLHAKGLRCFLNILFLTHFRRMMDIVIRISKIAVFVDGYSGHAAWLKSNLDYWCQEFETSQSGDADTVRWLNAFGWKMVRNREHKEAWGQGCRLHIAGTYTRAKRMGVQP